MEELLILQLQQVVIYSIATLLFGFAYLKKKELLPWLLVYVFTTLGIIFNYLDLRFEIIEILGILTSLFYLIAVLMIVSASTKEYRRYSKTSELVMKKGKIGMIFVLQVANQLFTIGIEILMIILLGISFFLMIEVFLKEKTVFFALIWISIIITIMIMTNNALQDFGFAYIEDFSSGLAIFLGAILVVAGIVAPLEERLFESEHKYRQLFESTPLAIVLVDGSGIIIDCNPAIKVLIQYRKEELVGKRFFELPAIPEETKPELARIFGKFLIDRTYAPVEVELRRKDGEMIWVFFHASYIKENNLTIIQGIVEDITERKKAEMLVKEEVKKLKSLEKTRKELITRVSHEFKTPLMSITGSTELLRELKPESCTPQQSELLDIIERGGTRLETLVANLIDISRIEFKKSQLLKEEVDICALIKDCVKNVKFLIEKRQPTFIFMIPDKFLMEIDKLRIDQVITNLMSNAIKNSPLNSEIHVKLEKMDGWVQISVIDHGIGLIEHELDQLFTLFGKIERYGEGQEYLNIQGSGLGLYISQRIMELHGGELIARSEGRHKGSTFIMRLPLKQG